MLIDYEWYRKHRQDISQEEIDSLGIAVTAGGKSLPPILQKDKKGKVKQLVEVFSEEETLGVIAG